MSHLTYPADERNTAKVLFVGESDEIRETAERLDAQADDLTTLRVRTATEARNQIGDGPVDCVVVEPTLPDESGIRFLREIRKRGVEVPIILFGIDLAPTQERTAIDSGATDVFRPEHDSTPLLRSRIERAVDAHRETNSRYERRGSLADTALDAIVRATSYATTSGTREGVDSGRKFGDPGSDEQVVTALLDSARDLRRATALPEAYRTIASSATTVSGFSRAIVYAFDSDESVLRPRASAPNAELSDRLDPIDVTGDSILSDVYVTGELHWSASPGDDTEFPAPPGRSVVIVPLENHGVLAIVGDDRLRVDERTRKRAHLLATTASTALDRIETGTELRERTEALDRQSTRLERLRQDVEGLLRFGSVIVESSSESELEEAVCREFVNRDAVAFAWIGDVDAQRGIVEPKARAGHGQGYLEQVDLSLDAPDGEPTVEAARNRETTGVEDVADGLQSESWRCAALSREFQGVLSVPLEFDGRFHGVLSLYASDSSVFDDRGRRIVDAIGDQIAYGLTAIENRRGLLTASVIEVEVELHEDTNIFSRIARKAQATLEFKGVLPRDDASVVFLAASDAPSERVRSVLEADSAVESVTEIDFQDRGLFEVRVGELPLLKTLAKASATPRSVVAGDKSVRLVVDIANGADARQFMESLEREYPSAHLASRITRARPVRSPTSVWATLQEHLTARQLEALRVAFLGGYFEWPRERTSEQVAETLDISQPTFNRHLRTAERKLLSLLFDPNVE